MSTGLLRVSGQLRGKKVQTLGSQSLIQQPLIGFFASSRTPSSLVLPTLDLMMEKPGEAQSIVSGFQSQLEKASLKILLAAGVPAVLVQSTPPNAAKLPAEWKRALLSGTMAVAWADGSPAVRASEKNAETRNLLILGMVTALFVVSGGTASRTYRLARSASASGVPLLCHDHPCERDLLLLGAEPVRTRERWGRQTKGERRA